MYNQIAIQPQHIKSCNPSPTHHPVGVGLHARPRGLSGHLTLTSIIQLPYTNTPTSCSRGQADRQTDRQTDRPFILINHSSFAIKMSQPNINTPNSDLVSSLSQSQSYLSPNFLVILPGLTSSVRLCGVERCPAQQSEEEEEEEDSTRFTRPVAATRCAIDATCRLPQYRVPVQTSRDVSSSETESDDLASGRVSFVAGRRIESWEQ